MEKIFLIALLILSSCKNADPKTDTKSNLIAEKKDTVIVKETIIKPTYNFDKNFVLGKFNYKTDASFTKVSAKHSSKTIYIKKEAYTSFTAMHNKAKQDGVTLTIISGTRNFAAQKGIWERKWLKYKNLTPLKRAQKILEFSSMPTTSRHHWGTDIDINNLNNTYFNSGKGKKEYDWLTKNANDFGFYQVYTDKSNGRPGYNLEKWHWSYLPLAKDYLAFHNAEITYNDINGFSGSELAEELEIIKNYVNGVSEKIKNQ